MSQRIATTIVENGDKRDVGMHPEKESWDMLYAHGVAYRVLHASKFMHRGQRSQVLEVRREK
jgi:hypothetical protein